MGVGLVEGIGLQFVYDIDIMLMCVFGYCLSYVGWVNVIVFGVIDCVFQIICFDQWLMFFDLIGCQLFIGYIIGFSCRCVEYIFVYLFLGLCYLQVIYDGEVCVKVGFFFKGFVEIY